MDSKICKICKVEKPLDCYTAHKRNKGGYKPSCKECSKKYLKAWRASVCKEHSVYYLPEEHYVGMTNNVRERMTRHRNLGKITEGYEILAVFERRVDAAWFEVQLHQRDYYGF